MSRVVTEATIDDETLDRVLAPRQGVVLEEVGSDGCTFEATEGPFGRYRRTVEVEALDGGRRRVRQTVEYRADVPYLGWLFDLLVRRHIGRLVTSPRAPWWSPPERLDTHATRTLASLCALSVALGYLGTLLTQTMTFAAREFGAGKSAQSIALAVVRADVVIAVGVVAWADRGGRRRALLLAAAVGCALTATGAMAPSLPLLATSQVAARGFVTAAVVIVAIMAAEEMPAGSRAYAVGLLAMWAALGAGAAVFLLPVADIAEPAWRLLFAAALAGLPLVASVARRLPESRRFGAAHADAPMSGHGRRFWLLAASAFLLSLFFAPAAQFSNEYLRTERHFSAVQMSLFTLVTATPGGIGIILGGRLAERGRRLVAAVGVVGGVGATVLMYLTSGWPLWAWSVVGSVLGAATVPSLGVYGPELFPTSLRGRANGLIAAPGRLGSVAGLLAAGHLPFDFGPTMALLALGPAILAVLVVVAYPETAHRELEEINPEDAPVPRPPLG